MKTGFRFHLFAGIAMIVLFQTVVFFTNNELFFNLRYLIFSTMFFILGSIMPDIDSKNSIPHRHFKKFYYIFASIFFIFISAIVMDYLEVIGVFYYWVIAVFVSLITAYLLVGKTVKKLRHRGFFHTLPMALVYGTSASLFVYILGTNRVISLIIGFVSMYGWYFHKIVDYIGDRIK
ncbi:MAG: metal-dependent hydrolase [Candidatus Nanoarchaeia archaeon]|nr:metal-dependent hydrolase [Candidatus Nanoarchaeia archaeon]